MSVRNSRLRVHATALLAALLLVTALPARTETVASDPEAVEIADEVMKALGGRKRWEKTGGLRWTYEVAVNDTLRLVRRHAWDRASGWYRVEGADPLTGRPWLLVKRLGTDEGRAWMNDVPVEGDSVQSLLRRAQSLWSNDGYWLLMPYRLRDDGVTLRHEGRVGERGRVFDKVTVTFDGLGERPLDRFSILVDRRTHRVDRWTRTLPGDPPPPVEWTVGGWERHGGFWFATTHRNGNRTVYTRSIQVTGPIPVSAFQAP